MFLAAAAIFEVITLCGVGYKAFKEAEKSFSKESSEWRSSVSKESSEWRSESAGWRSELAAWRSESAAWRRLFLQVAVLYSIVLALFLDLSSAHKVYLSMCEFFKISVSPERLFYSLYVYPFVVYHVCLIYCFGDGLVNYRQGSKVGIFPVAVAISWHRIIKYLRILSNIGIFSDIVKSGILFNVLLATTKSSYYIIIFRVMAFTCGIILSSFFILFNYLASEHYEEMLYGNFMCFTQDELDKLSIKYPCQEVGYSKSLLASYFVIFVILFTSKMTLIDIIE